MESRAVSIEHAQSVNGELRLLSDILTEVAEGRSTFIFCG